MNTATAFSSRTSPPACVTSSTAAESGVTDAELLRSYIFEKDGDVFTKLVQRHWPLVYGVAYRRTGNSALAQDIAQAVFILLDRKCADLPTGTVLAGWLFRTAMFTTKNALKAEARRKEREQQALSSSTNEETNAEQAWKAISKHLDEGLSGLSTRDRDAIILRFLQDRSFREVGASLGVNEHGARQQTLRALERLRKFFRRRGIFYPIASLALAFGARPAASAPLQNLNSEAAKSLAAAIIAQARRRIKVHLLSVGLMLVALLGFSLRMVQREARAESIARRQTIEAVDRTLWLADAPGFAALISFGSTDPARARTVFRQYCVAYHELRQAVVKRFGEPVPERLGTLQALSWLGGDRIREQPTVNRRNRAINQMIPGYSMHLIRKDGGWKWDLLDQATLAEANDFLNEIERKAAILHNFALRIQRGEFARGDDVAQRIAVDLSTSVHQIQ